MPGSDPSPVRQPPNHEAEISSLRGQVERLLFITEALWRILKEKHGLDDDELVNQITALDLEDGKLDGRKPATPAKPCPKRARMLRNDRPTCLYCGQPIAIDPFAR